MSALVCLDMIASVPGRPHVAATTRPCRGCQAWCGRSWQGDDIDSVTVIEDGDELVVAHTWSRPWATGGEDDPRAGWSEWRLAKVIEEL